MTQLDSAMIEPPPEVLIILEKIARSIGRIGSLEKGLELEKTLLQFNIGAENCSLLKKPLALKRWSFLKSHDPYHPFYRKFFNEYLAQYQDGTLDLHVPESNFSDLEELPDRDHPPPLKDFSYPDGITLMELGIIKLTALFVARYGKQFWLESIQTSMSPRFSFLN
ncbi:unnamed protein product [Arabis nemorensis]|uniref:SURP motif domain-containing protein n=1 Tax=Arabis nemorensis TaxID=586526 RepID=A0A565CMP9_9BRAS|nr:unnamed protein product [Arabis nemorensis]